MIDRSDLWQIGADALHELDLRRWKIWYADAEPETIFDHRPAVGTAYNLRFSIVTDDERFLTLWLRLPTAEASSMPAAAKWIKAALTARIREDHLGSVH